MKTLWMMLLSFSVSATAHVGHMPKVDGNTHAKDLYITIGSDAVNLSQKSIGGIKKVSSANGVSVLKLNPNEVENLSHLMHEKFKRCGGFIVHENEAEALETIHAQKSLFSKSALFTDYTITKGSTVNPMLKMVDEANIRETIIKLSSYRNRYYKSQTGIDSQRWVAKKWGELVSGRSDAKVELLKHSRFPQESVILTIEGSSKKDEVVVIGGHGDSVAGWWGRERAHAPGADDNASGISTITEVIRVLVKSGYKPERTIQFMSYAAEEVGLLGSKDIANRYKKEGKQVVGVAQFDMTNFKGTRDLDIVFMTDYTNKAQNEFMGSLIDTYLTDVSWGYSKCGYGCSDHASWHNAGFPASIPFESTMEDINGNIHTKRDTIDVSGSDGTAIHAEKFSRLGVAYLVEMGK